MFFLSASLFLEPTFTAPPPRRPPPPPLAPSQEFSDIFRIGSPKASADRPDGSSPIVYNSPHSTLRFYPSSGSGCITFIDVLTPMLCTLSL